MYRPIAHADVHNKTVLVRADLNVPLAEGRVTNAARLHRLAPGLLALLDRGAKVVLLSHFARPKGKVVKEMSLAPVAAALGPILARRLDFVPDLSGAKVKQAVRSLEPGQIVMLENLRFHPGEEANDPAFAQDLAALGDLYVNDAFSAAHRAHASTHALAKLLPAYAGDLMGAELQALESALSTPDRPVMAVVGGAKVSTKLDLLFNLISKVEFLVVGGGMANTFLHAQGIDIGASLHEPDLAARALEILERAQALGCQFILPCDAAFAPALTQGEAAQTGDISALPHDQMILDFGPKSVQSILDILPTIKTLIWNGPLGAFEFPPFAKATNALAHCVGALTRAGDLKSVAGGGDTVAALDQAGVLGDLTYVSTAGGAFLEWMEGRELPGVAVLNPL